MKSIKKFIYIINITILVSSSVYAQKRVSVDTIPKFLLEQYDIEDEIKRVTGRVVNLRKSSKFNSKQELINSYTKTPSSRKSIPNTRLKISDPNYFYFTSAAENDNTTKSEIIALGFNHQVKRGLNILKRLHGQFVVLNFDIKANPSAKDELISTLQQLSDQKLFFAIVIDRNFEFENEADKTIIRNLGLVKLAELVNGNTYIGYNHRGFINETSSQTTLTQNFLNEIAHIIQPQKEIEKNSKEINRFIAHAGGSIDGYTYTNSLNALDSSYNNGFRLFELDISETSDSEFVATHDWYTWSIQTGFQGTLPPTLAEYNSYKIWGKYEPLDMKAINTWFSNHPDAILVSDKVNEPRRFSDGFIDKSRLMMELFTLEAVKEGLNCGIKSVVPSEVVINEIFSDVSILSNLGIQYIAVSRWRIFGNEDLFLNCKTLNIKPFIYNIFDETLEVSNNMFYIYGLYASKWDYLKQK
jgi:hypothetical protein